MNRKIPIRIFQTLALLACFALLGCRSEQNSNSNLLKKSLLEKMQGEGPAPLTTEATPLAPANSFDYLFKNNENGVCGFQENPKDNPEDCLKTCGDGKCQKTEWYTCPKDCRGKGSLHTPEKTGFQNGVALFYNVLNSPSDLLYYLAYVKDGKILDTYFDTLFINETYYHAENKETWLNFIDYHFKGADALKESLWLKTDETGNNFAQFHHGGKRQSNAIFQEIHNPPSGHHILKFKVNTNTTMTEKYKIGIVGVDFFDQNSERIIDSEIHDLKGETNIIGKSFLLHSFIRSYFKQFNLNSNDSTKMIEQSVSFNIPKNVSRIKIYFQMDKSEPNNYMGIDDVSLTSISQPNINLVCNGNFSQGAHCWKNLYPYRTQKYWFHDSSYGPLVEINKVSGIVRKALKRKEKTKIVFPIPWGWRQFEKGMKDFNQVLKDTTKTKEEKEKFIQDSFLLYIEKGLKSWSEFNSEHLELIGFYLEDEGASPSTTTPERVSFLKEQLQKRKLKLYASPYNNINYEAFSKQEQPWRGDYLGVGTWPDSMNKIPDGLFVQPNVWTALHLGQYSFQSKLKNRYQFAHLLNPHPNKIPPETKYNPNDPESPNLSVPVTNFCQPVDTQTLIENGIPQCELSKTMILAYRRGLGFQLEWLPGLEETKAYGRGGYGRIRDYITYAIDHGLLKNSQFFFEGGYLSVFADPESKLALELSERKPALNEAQKQNLYKIYRQQYDEVYEYLRRSRSTEYGPYGEKK